jgi:hypothetical protein
MQWINQRGWDQGYAPYWVSAGVTHSGGGTGVTDRSQVVFGKVMNHQEYVTFPNYDAVGADYTTAFNSTSAPGPSPFFYYSINVNLWVNGGAGGGSRQKGDGDRYCDMKGIGSGKRQQKLRLANLITYR